MKRKRIVRFRKALVQTVLEHGSCSGNPLFSRLANQYQCAGPLITALRHLASRTHQGGDVDIVTTGVHDGEFLTVCTHLRGLGGIRQPRVFFQWQPVHVGTDHHGGSLAISHDGHDTATTNTFSHFVTQRRDLASQPL